MVEKVLGAGSKAKAAWLGLWASRRVQTCRMPTACNALRGHGEDAAKGI